MAENYPVEQVALPGMGGRPTLVTHFYNMLRRKLWDAEPNRAQDHRSLEADYDVAVVTRMSTPAREGGLPHVVHLHGESPRCARARPLRPHYIQQLTPDNSDVAPERGRPTARAATF
jgi:NAD-dependent deacetylase